MGLGRAGLTFFDPVAQALIGAGASDELKEKALTPMVANLQEENQCRGRTTYFIQSRPAPGQPWQRPAGVTVSWVSKAKALDRLADRREMQPGWEHRLMERITTVTEQPASET